MATIPKTKDKTVTVETSRTERPHVISFRISEEQQLALIADFNEIPITGIDSPKQHARKILCDYLAGRLVYKNKADQTKDFDTLGH